MIYVLVVFCTLLVIGIIVAIYEGKHAIIVDENEPFLRGDYDPRKCQTLKLSDVDKVENTETAKIIKLKVEKK